MIFSDYEFDHLKFLIRLSRFFLDIIFLSRVSRCDLKHNLGSSFIPRKVGFGSSGITSSPIFRLSLYLIVVDRLSFKETLKVRLLRKLIIHLRMVGLSYCSVHEIKKVFPTLAERRKLFSK